MQGDRTYCLKGQKELGKKSYIIEPIVTGIAQESYEIWGQINHIASIYKTTFTIIYAQELNGSSE